MVVYRCSLSPNHLPKCSAKCGEVGREAMVNEDRDDDVYLVARRVLNENTHGHAVDGTGLVARCGGVGLCSQCKIEEMLFALIRLEGRQPLFEDPILNAEIVTKLPRLLIMLIERFAAGRVHVSAKELDKVSAEKSVAIDYFDDDLVFRVVDKSAKWDGVDGYPTRPE